LTTAEIRTERAADGAVDKPKERSQLDVWATRAFIAYLVIAFPILLYLGRYHWFFADEWEYLANRSFAPYDLFRHHFGHWVTTPIVVFRGMYAVFGLRSYLPYQMVLIASHLGAAWLLFVVMRRSEVRPWIAACATSPFVLFGPGAQNLTWAFQIAFTFALLLGLTQLVLALHDGPIDRRDWLALGAGALGLTCSGVAPAVVLAVGVAVFIRRGWRPAAFQTAPLAAMYLTWYVLAEPETRGTTPTTEQLVQWVRDGETAAFEGLGHFPAVGAALAAMLLVGLVLTWIDHDWTVRRIRYAAPVGLLVGGLAFELASGMARASTFIGTGAESGRFVYVAGAMALPALALAAEAIVDRWRVMGAVVAFPFLVAIVPNTTDWDSPPFNGPFFDHRERVLVTLGYSPQLDETPDWVRTDPGIYRFMDMDAGFLKAARDDGHLPPRPDEPDPILTPQVPLWLGLAQEDEVLPLDASCEVHHGPVHLDTEVGDRFWLGSSVNVALSDGKQATTRGIPFDPVDGALVEVALPDLTVVMRPAAMGTFRLCEVPD
jgi:hypothetical protein